MTHDIQSVLDEYVHLLAGDARIAHPDRAESLLAQDVAARVSEALGYAAGQSRIQRPSVQLKAPLSGFARAFLEQPDTSSTAERPKSPARRLRDNPVLAAFNSPFAPFVVTTTSTGQEGLDFHRYCRRIMHWNLPRSPLDLEQREGRVDRYKSLGVRREVARHVGLTTCCRPGNPWALAFAAAEVEVQQGANANSILAPYWHFGNSRPIMALALNIPLSREHWLWERLVQEAALYRLVLGQADPQALLESLVSTDGVGQDVVDALAGMAPDLAPPPL